MAWAGCQPGPRRETTGPPGDSPGEGDGWGTCRPDCMDGSNVLSLGGEVAGTQTTKQEKKIILDPGTSRSVPHTSVPLAQGIALRGSGPGASNSPGPGGNATNNLLVQTRPWRVERPAPSPTEPALGTGSASVGPAWGRGPKRRWSVTRFHPDAGWEKGGPCASWGGMRGQPHLPRQVPLRLRKRRAA